MAKTRFELGVKNAKISVIFLLLLFVLNFFSRRIFIDCLGDDLTGLNSTLQNVLGFLNIAELGITSAIATSLYLPLFRNDREQINDLISIFEFLYRRIGLIVLAGGIVLACFLPLIFRNEPVAMGNVFMGYSAFLVTSLVSYFISYKQTLFSADQRHYIVVTGTNVAMICKVLLQIVLLKWIVQSYAAWLAIEVVFGVVYGFWINRRVDRAYPWLKTSYALGKAKSREYRELFVKIKQIIPHKVGGFVLYQTDNLVVFAVTSLAAVTAFANYMLIFNRLTTFVATAFTALGAGVGNLIAEGNRPLIKKLFWELNAFFFTVAGILTIAFFFLTDDFISLFFGERFVLDNLSFHLMLFNTFVAIIRIPVGYFLNGYQLFRDTWAPWVEASSNLLISIAAGYFMGIAGVMLGTALSLTGIVVLWKPIFLYRAGFAEKVSEYWRHVLGYLLLLAVAWGIVAGIAHFLLTRPGNMLQWTVNGIVITASATVVYALLMYFFGKGTRDAVGRVRNEIRKRRGHHPL